MIQISQEKGNFIIISDSSIILAPIVKNWLIKNGFSFNLNEKKFIYSKKIDLKFLERIYDFLTKFENEISLDPQTKLMLEEIKNQKENYQLLVNEALKIKKQVKKIETLKVPRMREGLSLKWYQRMSVKHATTLESSANFSVPGSGKTWMAYSTFFILKEKNIVNKLLVIAPLAAFKPWEIEYKEITGETGEILRLTGNASERLEKFKTANNSEIFLVNYSIAGIENLNLQELLKKEKCLVVIDESHHIKNKGAKRTNDVLELSRYAERRMILTGTPLPKVLLDLWTQFQFLYPEHNHELLGSYSSFKNRSEEQDAISAYSKILSPYFTRISKDMLNLPKAEFNPTNNGQSHVVKMGEIQRRIYNAIRGVIQGEVSQFRDDSYALRNYVKKAIIYLIEISIDPSLIRHNTQFDSEEIESLHMNALELLEKYPRLKNEPHSKYKKAISLAKESLKKDKKVIVWTNFIISVKKLEKYFNDEGFKCVLIYGAIPKDDEENKNFNRELEIEKFKTNNDYNVLIAIPASLAESVSLHKECHHAIYVDRTYNGGHYIQSLERIHRVGLDENVKTRYDIIETEDCIDQEIEHSLAIKKINMENFFNSSDLAIKDLDLEESLEENNSSNYSNVMGNEKEFSGDLNGIMNHINKENSNEK